jgi:DNA processing protein
MPATLPEEELRAWLRLSMEPGLPASQTRNLLAAIGLPQDIYAASSSALSKLVPMSLAAQLKSTPDNQVAGAIDRAIEWHTREGCHILTLADPAYPPSLLDSHDPPILLYLNGNPSVLSRPTIALVGARSATPAGEENARAFARYLAAQGWCIASGLARGIDAAAHEGALLAGSEGGSTVAVMGTGIDIVFPASNRDLAHRIAAQGAIVSEFPMGMRALPHHFPRRNRIVAGLARGVLVVEAARQSGSLITARLATEMGREVFAIPGSIHSPLSRGCHALIRQGARLVESGQDILEELGTPRPAAARKPADPREAGLAARYGKDAEVALQALGYDPVHMDTLASRSGLTVIALHPILLELELDGIIARQSDGSYQRLPPSE